MRSPGLVEGLLTAESPLSLSAAASVARLPHRNDAREKPILPPCTIKLSMGRISHQLLQIKQTLLILKALDESFQEH